MRNINVLSHLRELTHILTVIVCTVRYNHLCFGSPEVAAPSCAPMMEDEVKKWPGGLVGRLRDLTVFKELPGFTVSKSSGLTKARAAGGAAASDEGAPSLLAASEAGSLSAREKKENSSVP